MDSFGDIETYDDPRSIFFMEETTSTSNVEIDYTALQKSLQKNINQHGIISNLPLNTYLGYKKFISNALTIYMNNYKFSNTTQNDQVLHFTATGNKN